MTDPKVPDPRNPAGRAKLRALLDVADSSCEWPAENRAQFACRHAMAAALDEIDRLSKFEPPAFPFALGDRVEPVNRGATAHGTVVEIVATGRRVNEPVQFTVRVNFGGHLSLTFAPSELRKVEKP